ncbi:hypothetical protein B6V73_11545 [Thioclava sp. JM3]|uniref:hypothetical protein n=1 Tax=Thioclava sp. JM3 TaxID=1973004 RepID=UPI000B541E51|nr:hypothetical protein [Thioclava sp. JM3]OWY16632.1 hypothetical protein B6V73_11545 [Thioclava sp. JM3]
MSAFELLVELVAVAGFVVCDLFSEPLAVSLFFGSISALALLVAGVEVVSAFAGVELDFDAASDFAGVSDLVAGAEVGVEVDLAASFAVLEVSVLDEDVEVEDGFADALDFAAVSVLLAAAVLGLSFASGDAAALVSFDEV